ncbi:hypothetical protein TSAR_001734 [Trichomalopsis sarcophagae]|uniref:Uncharacterized protein n=1 Tax=Trichomalopsis sarcophagae TaxID=543379 RepID=A0A232ENQ3_9HYME|nr:hypothetical protein TSAR_001734 [Trichomalopsis sarcophagae]
MSLKCAVILTLALIVYTIERAEAQEAPSPAPWPADFNQAWTTVMNFINPAIENFMKAMPAIPGWPPAPGEAAATPAVPTA